MDRNGNGTSALKKHLRIAPAIDVLDRVKAVKWKHPTIPPA
jgi:hypothetical protein